MSSQWARWIALTASWVLLGTTHIAAAQPPTAAGPSSAAEPATAAQQPDSDLAPDLPPLLAAGLPAASLTRLVSGQQYISPLAQWMGFGRPASSASQLSRYYRSRGRFNLARVPEMFGDFRTPGYTLRVTSGAAGTLQTEMPLAAGIGGLRIAEDNQALPRNRLWFAYNHFHNAIDATPVSLGGQTQFQSSDLNRFVVAGEWVLQKGKSSIELRVPFGSSVNISGRTFPIDPNTAYAIESDSVGNLGVILKRLLYADACVAWSTGLGIETPTGSTASLAFANQQFLVDPEAVHLVPFMAYTERYDRWYAHLFTQLDVALNGDSLLASADLALPPTQVGIINAAPLLGIDIGIGYQLLEPPCRGGWGVAATTELHLTTALDDDDAFALALPPSTSIVNAPPGVSNTLLNSTSGLVINGGSGWSLRTAVAVPLLNERVFDAELIVQLNRLL